MRTLVPVYARESMLLAAVLSCAVQKVAPSHSKHTKMCKSKRAQRNRRVQGKTLNRARAAAHPNVYLWLLRVHLDVLVWFFSLSLSIGSPLYWKVGNKKLLVWFFHCFKIVSIFLGFQADVRSRIRKVENLN